MIWKCCWCGKYLEKREAREDELVIGGVCEGCLDKFEEELGIYEPGPKPGRKKILPKGKQSSLSGG